MSLASIRQRPLSYATALEQRPLADIDLVVIHCTELPDLPAAREYGEVIYYPQSGTGHSGHFYVDRDGAIEQWVKLDRIAHHVRDFNSRSVGIELVNLGRYPNWHHSQQQHMAEPYPARQIEQLIHLLRQLQKQLPHLNRIAGHQDLDTERIPATDQPEELVCRKLDPGPQFPWVTVIQATELERIVADAHPASV